MFCDAILTKYCNLFRIESHLHTSQDIAIAEDSRPACGRTENHFSQYKDMLDLNKNSETELGCNEKSNENIIENFDMTIRCDFIGFETIAIK
ncbi:Hypothetical predicted protein [Octopus vulgaris]|uniref:Uncharacterized protein n=1 Tax=Octopus vulgaris TaxID=6645 RepID=A0AA36BMH7_OCTVU|nr:Hypothetical predicted protein [Octopus vulgaris]